MSVRLSRSPADEGGHPLRSRAAEGAYWLLTIGTAARLAGELVRLLSAASGLR